MTQHATKRRGSRFGFIGEVIAELKKVVWLTKRETAYLTGLVLLVAAVTGVFLGAIDYGFSKIIDWLFTGG